MIPVFGAMIHQIFMQPVQEKLGEVKNFDGSPGQDNPTQIMGILKHVCHSVAEQYSMYKSEIT